MKNKIFLDSNILIYLHTKDESNKKEVVEKILKSQSDRDFIISTQVLFEFSFVMQRKMKLSNKEIENSLHEIKSAFDIAVIKFETLTSALHIASIYKYSFPDSLIIATALENNCNFLLSEDMHHEQIIEQKMTISSPFQ